MGNRRMKVLVLVAFFVIVSGIGSFILIKRDKESSLSMEQRYEHVQDSNTQKQVKSVAVTLGNTKKSITSNEQEVVTDKKNKADAIEKHEPDTVNTLASGNGDLQKDEKKEPNDEEIEKRCLALMHEQGWFKPEDIPITNNAPPYSDPPVGAYMWKEVKGNGLGEPKEKPPEVEARNKEIQKEIEAANAMGDAKIV